MSAFVEISDINECPILGVLSHYPYACFAPPTLSRAALAR